MVGCSSDNSTIDTSSTKNLIGYKYAHLLFDNREECENANELYFVNCAQVMEVISETEVNIYVTDILYKTVFYIDNNKFVVKSTPETYEFSEDLIFEIIDNGDLKLDEDIWIKYEEDIFE